MSALKKQNVLFVGSFRSKTKSGGLGGQMFASKTIIDSDLSNNIHWIKIDSTALSNVKTALLIRFLRASKRLIFFVFHLLFSKVDMVLIFTGAGASFKEKGLMASIAKSFGKYVIIAPRSGLIVDDFATNRKGFIGAVFQKVDKIICQSDTWKSTFEREFPGVNSDKFEVIRNALDTSKYAYAANKKSNSIVEILFIAWIDRKKGVYELMEAVTELAKEGLSFRLSMCGDGKDFNIIQEIVKERKLERVVNLMGWTYDDEKYNVLSRSDVFVLPTYYEGMPNALLEAMSSGLPSVVTSVGSIPDIVTDGVHGLLIEPRNTVQLQDALRTLINDEALRKRFGNAAREHILNENAMEVIIEKYRKIFLMGSASYDDTMTHNAEAILNANEEAEDFFTDIAVAFDDRYGNKIDFKNRFTTWSQLIDQWSKGKRSAYDLGCGSGRYSFYIASKGLKVLGVDASDGMLELCKKRKGADNNINIDFVKDKLPLGDLAAYTKVDFIISSSVIEYVEGFDAVMRDTRYLLNEDGIFIFSIPNKDSIHRKVEKLLYRLIGRPSYVRYLHNYKTISDFDRFSSQYGFALVDHRYYGEVNVLYRWLGKVLPRRYCNTLLVGVFKKLKQ